MQKKWIYRTRPEPIPDLSWAEELAISPVLLKILWNRGFSSKEEIDSYLKASLKFLTPPPKWPNVCDAAEIIGKALLNGKKMAVWGDYDADGITSTALILDVMEFHNFSILHHIPDRRAEGYGLNKKYIKELADAGCEVLLTVDCGISNVEAVEYAKSLGMTVVVSDHHLPPEALPAADALVDPRMPGNWPCQHLAGVGVAFYLMGAVNTYLAEKTGAHFKMADVLDLVALGTLADVMPLNGENRILAKGGLAKITKPKRPGLAALKIVSGYDLASPLNTDQAVFRLAPRLNAAGRMGNPNLALELLRTKDFLKATRLAQELDACNSQRKTEEARVFEEARKQAEELLQKKDYAALALFGEDWHPGIIGIVASRIVEEFNRPTIIFCQDEIAFKGSGRSLPNFNLYDGLQKISNLLIRFGGHKLAAGVSIDPGNLEKFREAFSAVAEEALAGQSLQGEMILEGELPFKYAHHEFVRELDLMQPFGEGNPEPAFGSLPLIVKERRMLGHSGEHVLLVLQEKDSGKELKAKAWRMAREFGPELVGQTIRIAYTPRIDSYLGMEEIDLNIKDWQKA